MTANQQKKILGYQLTRGQKTALSLLAEKENARFLDIPVKDFHKPLGAAAGIIGPASGTGEGKTYAAAGALKPMLVFCGFSQDELFAFLAQYRQSKAESVELKAMITMHNIFWTPAELQKELQKEQALVKKPGQS